MDYIGFKNFILEHADEDTTLLRLRFGHEEPQWNGFSAIDQIECRRRTRTKLPRFVSCPDTLFPSVISSEQATAEDVAAYHSRLAGDIGSFADLTAGLGIDSFHLSGVAAKGRIFERYPLYADALRHNAVALGIGNLEIVNADSIEFVRNDKESGYDLIFIDPARRDSAGRRTYSFADCEPDVSANFELLLARCRTLMIKASPMLDIKSVIRELPVPLDIHIVSLRGECKEVLVRCGRTAVETSLHCVNILPEGTITSFDMKESELGIPASGYFRFGKGTLPRYLYEPNASVMKTAPWGALQSRFPAIEKIGHDTHLFLCDTCYIDFPGRILKVVSEPDKKSLKRMKGSHLNVVSRNYPLTADKVAASLGVISGGEDFLYCFRDDKGKPRRLLACRE